jgi:hypothetical protein
VRIDDETRYQIRLGAQPVLQIPAQLMRAVIAGDVSNGAFVTYAALFAISDDDLARSPEDLAAARDISLRCFEKHLAQLEGTGWLERNVEELDQDDRPVRRILALRFTPRTEAASI